MPIPTYDELEAEIQRLRAENLNCDWATATIKEKDAAIKRYVDELDESRYVLRILVELQTMC
jgi:hypothetical protein